MGQYSDALGAHTSFLFHGLWPTCWQAVLGGFLKGTQSTSVTFHQGEAGKADIRCSIGSLRERKKKKKKASQSFSRKSCPGRTGQVLVLLPESCAYRDRDQDQMLRKVEQLPGVNNGAIHPEGKFLPDLIN